MTLSTEAQELIALMRKQNMKALFTDKEVFAAALEENRRLQQKPYTPPDFIFEVANVERWTSPSGFDAYTLTPKACEGGSAGVAGAASAPAAGANPTAADSPAAGSPIAQGPHILYFHGGAFFLQIDKSHWDYCLRLVQECDATVTVPIYPLAPTYTFRTVYAYLLEVYRWALGHTPAEQMVFMGDSAGGMFAVVLAQLAALEGLAQPRLIMPFSPVLELRPADPATINLDLEERDVLLSYFASDGLNEVFIGDDAALETFPANPMLGPIANLAPIVLYAGGDEIFSEQALVFAEKVQAAGGNIEAYIVEGMWHIFPLMQDIPESEQVNQEVFARLRKA